MERGWGDRPQEQDGLSSSADSNSRDAVGHGAFPHTYRRPKRSQPIREQVKAGRDRRQGGNKLGAAWQQLITDPLSRDRESENESQARK